MQILGDQVDTHWYYRAKAAAMLRTLRGTGFDQVLDVGAGSGFFSRHLLDQTRATSAICVDPNYPAPTRELHHGKPIDFVLDIDRFAGGLVLMMDVLEHVADDAALLAGYVARVPAGTRFLITVPALPWMWSGHDVFLEHFRRYTLPTLDRLVAGAGLRRVASFYYFGLALPLAAVVRLGRRALPARPAASDMKPQSPPVNAILLGLCRAELPLSRFNRLGGLSAFALAEKAP
jgi:SAM-dependent methyltransferase